MIGKHFLDQLELMMKTYRHSKQWETSRTLFLIMRKLFLILASTLLSGCNTLVPLAYDTDLYYVNHAPHPQGCECCLLNNE